MARQGMVSTDLWPKDLREVKEYYGLLEGTSEELEEH